MYRNFIFASCLALTGMLAGCQKAATPAETSNTDSVSQKNAVVETIMERRSIRKYKPQAIEKEKLDEIIRCGIYAPNGMGRESWEVRFVTRPELLARIDTLYADYMEKTQGKRPAAAAYGAPAVAFIAYDTTYDLSQVDCGLLGGNMLLAAKSMGIGSCCLGGICRFLNAPEGAEIMKKLDFPKTHKLLYAIAFGYPDETPKAKERTPEKVRMIE